MGMKIPKMDSRVKQSLEASLPRDGVILRPMFGNVAAFVNGNMFAGVMGDAVFVRLGAKDRAEAERGGAKPFEPMPGRPMKDYVEIPRGWVDDPAALKKWVSRAHTHTGSLPARAKKPAKSSGKKDRK
ncbi:MAG TPA: TfoX/Sxy family protein [Thermoplasmata archaeon]|nr:TfoX/Sxy family protein [Thermoplasmata archaeon]